MALAEYGNAFDIDTDGSGNPILIDAESGAPIAIYNRSSESWEITSIEASTGDFDSVNTGTVDSDSVNTGTVDSDSVNTEVLGGDLVDRVEGINHLEGNIYLTEEGASDPTENDGDLWFEYESE